MKIYENNPNYKFHENIGNKLENKMFRYQSKKPINFDSSSSDSSSEFNNIQYYENFLKSLKKENKSKTPNFTPETLYKKSSKKKHYLSKEFRKRLNERNSKGITLNDNNIVLYNSNDDSNNENYFFQIKAKSMSKNFMINKLNIEESPRKNNNEPINLKKNEHHKNFSNYLSNNKINEVDESINSPKCSKVKNEIIKVSSPKKHSHFFEDKNNNKDINNNQKKHIHNQDDNIKNNQIKLNLKNHEIKQCHTLNPLLKETDEKLKYKIENNTSRNNNNSKYSIPIKKKKQLLCFCIPFG